jgi:hypothetical protein
MAQTVDPDPWLQAARHYTRLDDPGRASYWNQLGPEQQAALTAALQHLAVPAAPVASVKKGGLFGVATVGCLGLVLGVVLMVIVQVVLVVSGLRNFLPELLLPSPVSTSRSGENPPDDAPALEYLASDCSGVPKSHDEELFCQVWKRVHPEP